MRLIITADFNRESAEEDPLAYVRGVIEVGDQYGAIDLVSVEEAELAAAEEDDLELADLDDEFGLDD